MLTDSQFHSLLIVLSIVILIFCIILISKKSEGFYFRQRRRQLGNPSSSECAVALKTYYDAKEPGSGLRAKMLQDIYNQCGPDVKLQVPFDLTTQIRGGNQMTAAEPVMLGNQQWCNSIQNSNVTNWGPYRCNPHNNYITRV